MYSVMLVDDEYGMLEGLRNLIDWEEHGFVVVATATNGWEALEQMKTQQVDLLITDITMPQMDGLVLVERAKRINDKLETVFLTCHRDFEYAKAAVELGVDSYMVKHTLTREELEETIHKMKSKLETLESRNQQAYVVNKIINQNRILLIENYFTKVLCSSYMNLAEKHAQAEVMSIGVPEKHYKVIGFYVDNEKAAIQKSGIEDEGLFYFSAINIIEESMESVENFQYLHRDINKIYYLYWEHLPKPHMKSAHKELLIELQSRMKEIVGGIVNICVSRVYQDMEVIKEALEEVDQMREEYFYQSGVSIVEADGGHKAYSHKDMEEWMRKITVNMKSNNASFAIRDTRECLVWAKEENISPKNLTKAFNRIIEVMEEGIKDKGKIQALDKRDITTIDGLEDALMRRFNDYFSLMDKERSMPTRKEIMGVLTYIDEHINQRITCEEMAKYTHMSRSYFSRIFKEEMNQSFSDYVLNRKIDYAKEMLTHTDYTIQDVCDSVGFDTLSNFYRMFKKITGLTPKKLNRGKTPYQETK